MASRKEYEMLFQLEAQLGGSFNNTFGKAQQQLLAMQKEIQALSKTQSDISAFQKQQSAVEATRQKLATLEQQYNNIQREIQETGEFSSGLQNKLLSKQQQIDRTTASLDKQTDKLQQMDSALREAGVDTSALEKESARLGNQMSELKTKQEEAANGAKSFGEQSVAAFDAISQAVVAAGVVKALNEIKDAYMECVSVAGDFEEAMSTVEALSGANAGELAQLSAMAKELGATTKFTATESADAMGYMAMAGWDANDMLQGMDGVLQLAAASGEDLAMVSDIVTDSLSAFGLTAKDTAHFSDVLAAAATNSNTNVAIMGETFKMSASVAGALGYSIEDVAVAMGLMANSGVKGSIAGTALKNTFNGLLEGVTLTGAAFGEYEYSAIRADGTMKDFGATINELREYFGQMTEAERVNNAITIAGQRGYNGLLAILNATEDDYVSLTAAINNCTGSAQRMASIKLDNMNGQLTLMKSAWDALKASVGEQFIPAMRHLYEVGTEVFSGLNMFVKANPGLVKGIAAGAVVIGTVTAALMAYSAGAKVAAAASALLSASIPGVNIIMGVTAAVAGITAAVVSFASATNEGIPSVKELTKSAQEMGSTMEDAATAYDETVSATLAAANVADTYISKLEEMGEYASLSKGEQEQYHNTLVLLTQLIPDLASSIDLENNAIEGGTAALRANTDAWKQNAMAQAYQDQLTAMYAAQADVLIEAEKNSIGLLNAEAELDAATQKQKDTVARMNELWAEASKAAEKQRKEHGSLADATSFLTQEYYDLQNSLDSTNEEIRIAQGTVNAYQEAINEGSEAVAAAESEISLAEEAVRNLTGATEEQISANEEAAQQTEALQGVIDSVTSRMADLSNAYTEAYGAALDSISGQYDLWDSAATVIATSADSINSALESQIDYWQSYNANLQSLTDRASDIDGLSAVIGSFADGSAESVNAVAGMASATDEELSAMVANWQELQAEQDAAAGSVADLKTDFSKTMDELQAELAKDIEAMDLGPEARSSGKATIQGFVDGASSMLPQVIATYTRIANAAKAALEFNGSGGGGVGHYAVGTQSAAPGFALVGEEGPELVYFNGGEKVMTAEETAALRDRSEIQAMAFAPQLLEALHAVGGANTISAESGVSSGDKRVELQIVFQIQGNATPETVDMLRDYGDDFAERVLAVIQDAEIDRKRVAI